MPSTYQEAIGLMLKNHTESASEIQHLKMQADILSHSDKIQLACRKEICARVMLLCLDAQYLNVCEDLKNLEFEEAIRKLQHKFTEAWQEAKLNPNVNKCEEYEEEEEEDIYKTPEELIKGERTLDLSLRELVNEETACITGEHQMQLSMGHLDMDWEDIQKVLSLPEDEVVLEDLITCARNMRMELGHISYQ